MPVESLLVINLTGSILHSVYLNNINSSYARQYEQCLFKETSKVWNRPLLLEKQTVVLAGVFVVFQRIGDLVVFVGGSNEIDEIICKSIKLIQLTFWAYLFFLVILLLVAELHETIVKVLKELLNNVVSEKDFLNVENYGKVL